MEPAQNDSKQNQHEIMLLIDSWVKTKKTVVPKREIIAKMTQAGKESHTIENAINSLIKKKYIKRSSNSSTSGTFYIQIRTL